MLYNAIKSMFLLLGSDSLLIKLYKCKIDLFNIILFVLNVITTKKNCLSLCAVLS